MASVWNHFKQALGSAVDITKAALGSAAETTTGALGSAVGITRETVTVYLGFLRNLVKWSVIVPVVLLPLPIVGTVFHWSWMTGLYLLVLGLICIALLMAASPFVMLAQLGYEHIKPYRKMAQLRAGVAFWGLLIVVYFWLVPVWNYPTAIPLIFIICVFLAVAFVRFGYSLNPKLFFRLMLGLLLLITVFCYMPASRSAAGTFVAWLDASIAGLLTSPSHPVPKGPRRIGYDLSSIDTITFFDPLTSEPRVWYYAGQDGRIELFDGPGYHPQYKGQLEPITPAIVAQIRGRLDADAQERVLEEKRRKEEAERLNPTPPRRIDCDYGAIDKIVFFDPLTAEPKVWYYKAQDGTIDLFEGPGYHPQYGEELKPITPEIVTELKQQLKGNAEKTIQGLQEKQEEPGRTQEPPRAVCSNCGGSGTAVCQKCNWRGEVMVGIKSATNRCPECNGAGQRTCAACEGTGRGRLGPLSSDTCWTCNGRRHVKCVNCDGTGRVTSDVRVYERCRLCGGSKRITCPICGGRR